MDAFGLIILFFVIASTLQPLLQARLQASSVPARLRRSKGNTARA